MGNNKNNKDLQKNLFVFIIFLFMAVFVSGCAEESDGSEQKTEPTYEFETDTELAALKVTLTQVGSPVWKPTGFSYFSAPIGNEGNGFADLLKMVHCYSSAAQQGKNYFSDLNVYIPEREHPTPYYDFIPASLAACSYTNKQTFTVSEFTDPNAIVYVFQLLPIEGLAPVGKSPYKDQELIIPNSKFPITIDGALYKVGITEELDSNFDSTLPALNTLKYRDSNDAIPGDGYPHIPLLFGDAYDFIKAKIPNVADLPGVYEFRVQLRDAEQSGWNIVMSYTLE